MTSFWILIASKAIMDLGFDQCGYFEVLSKFQVIQAEKLHYAYSIVMAFMKPYHPLWTVLF